MYIWNFVGTDIFAQVVLNLNRTFQCENILNRLSTTSEFVFFFFNTNRKQISFLVQHKNVNYGNN